MLRYQLAEQRSPFAFTVFISLMHIQHVSPQLLQINTATDSLALPRGPVSVNGIDHRPFYRCTLISSCCTGDQYAAQSCVTAAGKAASRQQVPLRRTASLVSSPGSLMVAVCFSKVAVCERQTRYCQGHNHLFLCLMKRKETSKQRGHNRAEWRAPELQVPVSVLLLDPMCRAGVGVGTYNRAPLMLLSCVFNTETEALEGFGAISLLTAAVAHPALYSLQT